MMMIYGMMPFMRQTLPYGELQQNIDYRWPTNSRIGLRPAAQFIGVGDEKITLSGELRPEITGGAVSLMTVRLLADQGMAWPLIGGSGMIYGMYVIESISNTHSEFFPNGTASKIMFTLNLMRVDGSLTSMFGDLKKQADGLIGGVSNLPGQITAARDSAKSSAGGLFG
ncbi:phage tail protein [Pantoea trifolii]|uniref:Phage tail protein n=1 Tax=Pantoea trifolii TaxID=2968030 RepID=A0ABT1VNG8_9GAMM|nr:MULTISPECIES: phage tail protein [unclassified Pantoea]MCQ8229087.1 phage tail protein [Pantoea sp. MMK2]MCQ8237261.1 phage tail protein [Pantoea sp. MMK3]